MKKEIVSFGPHDSLFDVAEVMSKSNITGAPVIEGRKVVGIISVSDIMKFMTVSLAKSNFFAHEPHSMSMMAASLVKQGLDIYQEIKKLSKTMVKDFMNRDVLSISPDATIIEVAEALDKNDVNRLPVIDGRGRLVGIISKTDIVRAMLD